MIHELPLERRSLHGHFSPNLEPALTVDAGDSVRVDVPNAGWELVAGSVLFLPIPVDGALLSVGDTHGLQGDGEVSGTAIESPGRGQVRLDVLDAPALEWPVARTSDAWITFGFGPDLDAAARTAIDGMIGLLGREHGLEPADALMIASLVVDLRVTQIVNESVGVHAVLRDGVL